MTTSTLPELADIRSLEEALHRPEVRRSRDALEALLAVGYVEFGASGAVYNRATIIDLLIQEDGSGNDDLRTTNYALTTISDDVVLLTYEASAHRTTGQSGKFCEARSGSVPEIGGSCFSTRVRSNEAVTHDPSCCTERACGDRKDYALQASSKPFSWHGLYLRRRGTRIQPGRREGLAGAEINISRECSIGFQLFGDGRKSSFT